MVFAMYLREFLRMFARSFEVYACAVTEQVRAMSRVCDECATSAN